MTKQELANLLADIQSKLSDNVYPNEESVKMQIVLPILHCLGWQTLNPEEVYPEYPLKYKKEIQNVDFVLFADKRPPVAIEVKRTGFSLDDAEEQLHNYAVRTKAKMSISTNGQEWRFHLPYRKPFQTIDLSKPNLDDAVDHLRRYLRQSQIKSDRATKAAEQQDAANEAIPAILQEELAKNHPLDKAGVSLFKAVFNRAKKRAGHAPDADKVRDHVNVALSNLGYADSESVKNADTSQKKLSVPSREIKKSVWSGQYILFGKIHKAGSAIDAYTDVFRQLEKERGSSFLERIAPDLETKTFRMLARGQRNIWKKGYQGDDFPDTKHVVGDWYVHTRLDNDDKNRFLRRACESKRIPPRERIPFDDPKGLKIDFPNVRKRKAKK